MSAGWPASSCATTRSRSRAGTASGSLQRLIGTCATRPRPRRARRGEPPGTHRDPARRPCADCRCVGLRARRQRSASPRSISAAVVSSRPDLDAIRPPSSRARAPSRSDLRGPGAPRRQVVPLTLPALAGEIGAAVLATGRRPRRPRTPGSRDHGRDPAADGVRLGRQASRARWAPGHDQRSRHVPHVGGHRLAGRRVPHDAARMPRRLRALQRRALHEPRERSRRRATSSST